MDNASIHTCGKASILKDLLYQDHSISVLFLPTRSPELNPIDQMWHLLHEHLVAARAVDGANGHYPPDHVACWPAAFLAAQIMHCFTDDDIYACYYHSKYV